MGIIEQLMKFSLFFIYLFLSVFIILLCWRNVLQAFKDGVYAILLYFRV